MLLEYVGLAIKLGKLLTDMFSLALGLREEDLRRRLLEPEPVVLFRCFKCKPVRLLFRSRRENNEGGYGISEYTGQAAK